MKILVDQRNIIVPWDFSKTSKLALLRAVELVDDVTRIHAVHVSTPLSAMEYGTIWNALHERTIVGRLTNEFLKQIELHPELQDIGLTVLFGDPGTRVCEFAEEIDAAMIVMPSHGRTGMARLFLGSVAERIVRLATCPVLVLRDLKPLDESKETDGGTDVLASVIF